MGRTWSGVLLLIAIGAAAPRPGRGAEPGKGPGAAAPAEVEDPSDAPPLRPADRALWRSGQDVTVAMHVERSRATRLQLVLLNLRYRDRLRVMAERGGADAERAERAAKRLHEAHGTQFFDLTARWPVDPYRGCGYPALEFGSIAAYAKADPVDVERARTSLRSCVDAGTRAVEAMKGGNDALEAAMKDAGVVLAAAGLGDPTAGLAAAGARPKPAPASDAHEAHEAHESVASREEAQREPGKER